jgi:hypothetical protein
MKYKVINNHGEEEYTLAVDKAESTHYWLFYSYSEHYNEHIRGTLAMGLEDNGNGYIIKKSDKSKRGEMRYDEAAQLFILLSFVNKTDTLFGGKIGTFDVVVSI